MFSVGRSSSHQIDFLKSQLNGRFHTLKQGCGNGGAKNLPLPLPHGLFDLKSDLAKTFCPFPDVD